MTFPRCFFLASNVILVVFFGCGSGRPYDTVSVSGEISYEDGSRIPASQITLIFIPQVAPLDAKTHPRPAVAEVDVNDGTFSELTTWEFGDGAIPGKHKIQVHAYDELDEPSPSVPPVYGSPSTTPLEVEIRHKTTDLKLTIKKP